MKRTCQDIMAAYAFGAKFSDLFEGLEQELDVPACPDGLDLDLPFLQPQALQEAAASGFATASTTVQLPIHLEPKPPTCARSPYSCCCGMAKDGGAAAGGCSYSNDKEVVKEEDALSTATWATEDDDDGEDEAIPKAPLVPIPEGLESHCSCASAAGLGDQTHKIKQQEQEDADVVAEGTPSPPHARGAMWKWARRLAQWHWRPARKQAGAK